MWKENMLKQLCDQSGKRSGSYYNEGFPERNKKEDQCQNKRYSSITQIGYIPEKKIGGSRMVRIDKQMYPGF